MKMSAIAVALMMVSLSAQAQTARKDCLELKSEIEANIAQKGVKNFVLEILPKEQESADKVVGTCDGGTKKITYKRN